MSRQPRDADSDKPAQIRSILEISQTLYEQARENGVRFDFAREVKGICDTHGATAAVMDCLALSNELKTLARLKRHDN